MALTPEECTDRVLHTTILNTEWQGCKKIVGECGWIREHKVCPRGIP